MDIIRPCEPLPASPVLARRFARGQQFEEESRAAFSRFIRRRTSFPAGRGEARMPRSGDEGRVARSSWAGACPSISPAGGWASPTCWWARRAAGYRPVDIKHHRTLDAGPGGWPRRCSPLDARYRRQRSWSRASRPASAQGRPAPARPLPAHVRSGGPGRRRSAWAASSASRGRHLVRPRRPQLADPVSSAGRSGARRWRSTTSSSTSASTSSRSPPTTRTTRRPAARGPGAHRRVRGLPLVVVVRTAAPRPGPAM